MYAWAHVWTTVGPTTQEKCIMRDANTDKVAAFMNENAIQVELFTQPEKFVQWILDCGALAPTYESLGAIETSFVWPCGYGHIRVNWYRGMWRAKYA